MSHKGNIISRQGMCAEHIKNHYYLRCITPTVKPRVTQSVLTFDSMDRHLKCEHSLESHQVVLYCGAVCFFDFPKFVILEDLTLPGVKGLMLTQVILPI